MSHDVLMMNAVLDLFCSYFCAPIIIIPWAIFYCTAPDVILRYLPTRSMISDSLIQFSSQ
jgi:hypothetical protein